MHDELIKNLRKMQSHEYCVLVSIDGFPAMQIIKQAADAIEELQQITTHYEEESKGWWLAACDAKEERERLKEQIPKWISVTERLPEDGAEVLAFNKTGFAYVDCWTDGKWKINSMVDEEHESVTHWMPLPQPPERKE